MNTKSQEGDEAFRLVKVTFDIWDAPIPNDGGHIRGSVIAADGDMVESPLVYGRMRCSVPGATPPREYLIGIGEPLTTETQQRYVAKLQRDMNHPGVQRSPARG